MDNFTVLNETMKKLCTPGKGILAADESTATIEKRFAHHSITSTPSTRLAYRSLLFSNSQAMTHICGVILYDETLKQTTPEGVKIPDLIKSHGALPGIKVDIGAQDMPSFPGEKITRGLDHLKERLEDYFHLGARFTKWRAVFEIDPLDSAHKDKDRQRPTRTCLEANCDALSAYASLAQNAGLVPIVEPEVLMESASSLTRCCEVTKEALDLLFARLHTYRVNLEAIILKPNMVLPGLQNSSRNNVTPQDIAQATYSCLASAVPTNVRGIFFLSGGQNDQEATRNLNNIVLEAQKNNAPHNAPWYLSFSYGRALQNQALERFARNDIAGAQTCFAQRASMNALATRGQWTAQNEESA